MNPYETLANAIVKQAATDYIKALKQIKRFPNDKAARAEKQDLERFFRSDWYHTLTSVDSEYLIGRLQAVVV